MNAAPSIPVRPSSHSPRSLRRHMRDYCIVADCEEVSDGHGDKCAMHAKRLQRDPSGRTLRAPKAERLSVSERLIEGCIALADADGDEQFDSRKRYVLGLARQLGGRREDGERIRLAMAEAKARGVRLGRPPVLTPERAAELLAKEGSAKRIAATAGVSLRTVRRVLRVLRQSRTADEMPHSVTPTTDGPRAG